MSLQSVKDVHCSLFLFNLKYYQKGAFAYSQNAQTQISLRMRKVSSGPLFSIDTFNSVQ